MTEHPIDLDALEVTARAAIGEAVFQKQTGSWSFEEIRDEHGPIPIVFAVADGGAKTQVANLEAAWEREARGAHIAAFDPQTALALIERVRVAEAAVARIEALRVEWQRFPGSIRAFCGDDLRAALDTPTDDNPAHAPERPQEPRSATQPHSRDCRRPRGDERAGEGL